MSRRPKYENCRVCGVYLAPKQGERRNAWRKWCSDECQAKYKERAAARRTATLPAVPIMRKCEECTTDFRATMAQLMRPGLGRFCTASCRAKWFGRQRRIHADENACKRHSDHVRRARLRGAKTETFAPVEIFERDGWKCGICGKKVDRRLKAPDPMAASLDHITSIAEGGDHSRANTQCSHWICNSRKSWKSSGQMRLFG